MVKMRVLVIDDSQVARRMLVSQLQELGYSSVVVAENGKEALQKLVSAQANNNPFGLIITDLRMPNMSGTELLTELSKSPDFRSIPKIIVSVETERKTVLEAVLRGADGYVLKPTTIEVLRDKLEKILAKGTKKAA